MHKDDKCATRLKLSAAMVVFAIVRVVHSSFVFSGDATSYYRFVQGVFRRWLITASFAAVALVVVIPVFWQGSRRQVALAGMVFTLAGLVLLLCKSILREY